MFLHVLFFFVSLFLFFFFLLQVSVVRDNQLRLNICNFNIPLWLKISTVYAENDALEFVRTC